MKFVKAFILVIAVQFAHAQVNCITTGDQLGPYFKWGAPYISNDTLAPGILDTTRSLELTFYVSYDCDTVDLDTLPSTYTLQIGTPTTVVRIAMSTAIRTITITAAS